MDFMLFVLLSITTAVVTPFHSWILVLYPSNINMILGTPIRKVPKKSLSLTNG
jgi:hypothetical protein